MFRDTFVPKVAKRGAEIIEARGASSAASAANAVVDTVASLHLQTPNDRWHSVAVCSDGSYGVEKGLMSSFPVQSDGSGNWNIVQGIELNDYSRSKVDASVQELIEEREAVKDLL